MSGYIGNIPVPQATQSREVFTATSGQTTFATVGYPVGFVDVWLNGVKLINGTDFTATNGSDVVLTVGATTGDTVEVISNSTFEVNSQTFTGGLTVNNDAATVLTVDRATSDGTLVDFKKNGTVVGSIGVRSSEPYLSGTNYGLRVRSASANIIPVDANGATTSDGVLSLGQSGNRFKDLYLSGGVYLGGTGAANLLDDYEEGDYIPTITATGGGSITLQAAYDTLAYTKVGRKVTVTGLVVAGATTSPSGVLQVSLPFVIGSLADTSERSCPMSVCFFNGTVPNGNGYYATGLFMDHIGVDYIKVWGFPATGLANTTIANWVTSGTDLHINVTYFTN